MLISLNEILPLLRCPRSHSNLLKKGNDILVAEDDPSIQYQIVSGSPVIIDFANSIFNEDTLIKRNADSAVKRTERKGIMKIVKHLISPPKAITSENVKLLIKLLKQEVEKPQVLIIGGGSIGQGMSPFYDREDLRVVAFDVYISKYSQFIADAHQTPLKDRSFDCVIIQAVLEHVLEPYKVISEIHRLLKPKGLVYAETPFMQEVHEGAYDFTRFTESGHRYLFRDFEKLKSGCSAGPGTQLMWSIDYFFRGLCRSQLSGRLAKLVFFWLRYFDNLIPASFAIDGASGVYFLGRKSKKRLQKKEIIQYYQGAQ